MLLFVTQPRIFLLPSRLFSFLSKLLYLEKLLREKLSPISRIWPFSLSNSQKLPSFAKVYLEKLVDFWRRESFSKQIILLPVLSKNNIFLFVSFFFSLLVFQLVGMAKISLHQYYTSFHKQPLREKLVLSQVKKLCFSY